MNKIPIDKRKVTTKQLADILKVSPSRIRQMSERGILAGETRKGKSTCYRLGESIQRLLAYRIERAERRAKETPALIEARLRKLLAEAQLQEQRVGLVRSRLHQAENVKMIINEQNAFQRKQLAVFSEKCASACAGINDHVQIRQILSDMARAQINIFRSYFESDWRTRNTPERLGDTSNDLDGTSLAE
jgi:phage terminase Nu1 subunit (DNA packaging protein)